MPHSTSPSTSPTDTLKTFDLFDLGVEDPHPISSTEEDEEESMTSQSRNSGAYGVAITSHTPSRDERQELPSQRASLISNRRKSAPGTHTYSDVMEQGGPVQDGAILRRDAGRENRRSMSYNEESKRRSQAYDPSKIMGPGMPTPEKVQRHSPVVAELKTNVIVSCIPVAIKYALPHTNDRGLTDQRRIHTCD